MTERLTSADSIEAWRAAAARADNPATWRVGDELRARDGGSVGWVRSQGRDAVLIESHAFRVGAAIAPRWVSHHDAARDWRRCGGPTPDDIDD